MKDRKLKKIFLQNPPVSILRNKKNLTIETNIPTSENQRTNLKTSLNEPISFLIEKKKSDNPENTLKARIQNAKNFFKYHINIGKNSKTSQNSSQNIETSSNIDIYSFLKHQERRVFLNKKTDPFNLFKTKILLKKMLLINEKSKENTYTREKKQLEDYIKNPEKSPENLKLKLKKALLNTSNSESNRKTIEFSCPLSEKMSELKEKYECHRAHNWESLVPVNNEFLNKKELGLKEFYENSKSLQVEIIPLEFPQSQMNINKTPKPNKLKSYISPKMSAIRIISSKKTAVLKETPQNFGFRQSVNMEFNREKNNKDIPFDVVRNLDAFYARSAGTKKNESILTKRGGISVPDMNLSETFELEKLQEYKNFIKVKELDENERNFLEAVKKNDLVTVERMAKINKNLIKIRDRHLLNPLHWAAKRGYGKMIDLLTRKGAKTEAIDMLGRTPKEICLLFGHNSCLSKLTFTKNIKKQTEIITMAK